MKTNRSNKAYTYLKIQDWNKEDRPREKLITMGRHTLSNVELLAILIRSGTQHVSAVDLAQHILKAHDYNLNELAKRSVEELLKFKGIGQAKAVTIVSAMELATRRSNKADTIKKINASKYAYTLMKPKLLGKLTEEFWIILLNRNNHVIKTCQISKGGLSKTIVDPKMVFKSALEHSASGIILVHNHPSGNPKPSQQDIGLTKNLENGSHILDIKILDHIIFTENSYFSFADEGILEN